MYYYNVIYKLCILLNTMYIKLLCIVVHGFIQWGRGIDFRPNLFQHATPSLYKTSRDLETIRSNLDHCILYT